MSAHEVAGRTSECVRHGRYIGGVCPVCEGRRKPGPRPLRSGDEPYEGWLDRLLRERPKSGPVDE